MYNKKTKQILHPKESKAKTHCSSNDQLKTVHLFTPISLSLLKRIISMFYLLVLNIGFHCLLPPYPSGCLPFPVSRPPWWCWSGHCWSTSPWLRIAGRRRCAHRWSRLDWHSGSRLGSSSRTAPQPRCEWKTGWQRRCPTPGRAGCQPMP